MFPEGRRVRLRPITSTDYDKLYLLELQGAGPRWRFGGRTPSPEAFVRSLFEGVLVNALVVEKERGTVHGSVTIYNADTANGHAYIAGVSAEPARSGQLVVEGLGLLVEHTFSCWPFRKLYMEAFDFTLDQFRTGVGWILEEEGRLHDFLYREGRYWDKYILSLSRESWNNVRPLVIAPLERHQQSRAITWDDFVDLLKEFADCDVDKVDESATLRDSGMDSLNLYAALTGLEGVTGELVPSELIPSLITLRDLFALFEAHLSHNG